MVIPYLDPSALAKWYLNEDASDAVEAYLRSLPWAQISSLTRIELRCLLARRRRNGEISPQLESQIYARFQSDIRQDHLRESLLTEEHVEVAIEIMESLPEHALRTLDALHLALLRSADLEALATADRTMSAAAKALGIQVETFFPPPA